MAGLLRLSIFVVLLVLLPDLAASDLIFLKDGSQVKAQNVWEENDRIHFTLPGYDGIVVTYAKEIVLRIEKEKAVTGAGASPPEARPQRPATESAAGEKALSGIQFYDPRRHTKYQTGTTTSYHTLKEAVDDLATKFDKTPRWVELNLGDTNDLGQIYRNLSRSHDNAQPEF